MALVGDCRILEHGDLCSSCLSKTTILRSTILHDDSYAIHDFGVVSRSVFEEYSCIDVPDRFCGLVSQNPSFAHFWEHVFAFVADLLRTICPSQEHLVIQFPRLTRCSASVASFYRSLETAACIFDDLVCLLTESEKEDLSVSWTSSYDRGQNGHGLLSLFRSVALLSHLIERCKSTCHVGLSSIGLLTDIYCSF